MHKTISSQNGDHGKDRNSSEELQENISPYPQELNITEGGEFLDDAIRTKDQPFGTGQIKEDA